MPQFIDSIRGHVSEEPGQPENSNAFLLYHARSHVTGNRLGDYLGVPHGRECRSRYQNLIRWGSRSSVEYAPSNVHNAQSQLQNASEKYQSLEQLRAGGVPIPEFTRDRDEISDTFGYPALGRADSHSRGEDINLIMQWRDAYLTDNNDYFVEYIPTDFEYRMHVIDGEVVKIHEKRLRSDADNHPYIRNHETGWVFVEPREQPPADQIAIDAVGSLGLDFGAVDVIMSEDGDPYVLEVNTAPSLDETNMEIYGDAFAEMCGISDYPGLEAVDFSEEEEDDG